MKKVMIKVAAVLMLGVMGLTSCNNVEKKLVYRVEDTTYKYIGLNKMCAEFNDLLDNRKKYASVYANGDERCIKYSMDHRLVLIAGNKLFIRYYLEYLPYTTTNIYGIYDVAKCAVERDHKLDNTATFKDVISYSSYAIYADTACIKGKDTTTIKGKVVEYKVVKEYSFLTRCE